MIFIHFHMRLSLLWFCSYFPFICSFPFNEFYTLIAALLDILHHSAHSPPVFADFYLIHQMFLFSLTRIFLTLNSVWQAPTQDQSWKHEAYLLFPVHLDGTLMDNSKTMKAKKEFFSTSDVLQIFHQVSENKKCAKDCISCSLVCCQLHGPPLNFS